MTRIARRPRPLQASGRALVVLAHPCEDSLGAAAARRATDALERSGAHVDLLDLYAIDFNPVMSTEEHRQYLSDAPILDQMVREHAELVRAAHTLVFVYPTWWSGPPAILKGWLERVLVSGVSFHLDESTGRIRPGLTELRQIVGISTYGSPWLYVRAINDNGRRILCRSLRLAARRRARTAWIALYAVDTATLRDREDFLARIDQTLGGGRTR